MKTIYMMGFSLLEEEGKRKEKVERGKRKREK